jgi:hypothetical protein
VLRPKSGAVVSGAPAKPAWTPGPWVAQKAPHGPIDIFDGRGRDVVTVYGGGVGAEDQNGNARLIAAAPELYEALLKAEQFISNGVELGFIRMPDVETPDSAHDTLPAVRAALAKARGEQ